ncbi:hypothetical protein ACTUSR_02980 [Pantoea stewartii subsp. indologenes]|uniref:hypothetical protein n=1 Tax=Pantoea stewartii TaxID=66269 RepID=UPI003FA4501E
MNVQPWPAGASQDDHGHTGNVNMSLRIRPSRSGLIASAENCAVTVLFRCLPEVDANTTVSTVNKDAILPM